MVETAHSASSKDNPAGRLTIPALALGSTALYLGLALGGDLRGRPLYVAAMLGSLSLVGLAAWLEVRRRPDRLRLALWAALAFRLAAAPGTPALSDDVYRYVWDGRVQLHGVHPYRLAPDAPELAGLRDADWRSINHPELRTIYPPLAEMAFAALAALGAGPLGFKLAAGLADIAVVLALLALLRRLGLPADRVMLYAWNPLAVIETAGSGHVEPFGVALVVLAATCIIGRRPGASTLALAGAIDIKLLPLVLVPGWIRRLRARWVGLLLLAMLLPVLPYALTGPPVGAGLFAYAERWERNAVAYDVVRAALRAADSGRRLEPAIDRAREALGDAAAGDGARGGDGARSDDVAAEPWTTLRAWVWPDRLARVVVAGLALVWVLWLSFRRGLDAARESYLALAGVLLLSPTLHPWYLLWVLPFAAAYRSWPWLLLVALAPLAYVSAGEVPWAWRAAEYGPPVLLAAGLWLAARRRGPDPSAPHAATMPR